MDNATKLLTHLIPLVFAYDDYEHTDSVTVEYNNGLKDRIKCGEIFHPNIGQLKNDIYESIFRNAKLGLFPVAATVDDNIRKSSPEGYPGMGGRITHCTPDGVVKEKE